MSLASPHTFLQPDGWLPAKGYANGVLADGAMIFTGGLVGWNAQQEWEHEDMASQFRQLLENIVAVLDTAGAKPEHIVRLTWYITDKDEYHANLRSIGAAYRDIIGRHFPAMAVVQVTALMEDAAKIEIEATAVLPRT
tara:strand:+ start:3649 stop:4062 length:414 start_codon:yes stop_codon:yes gene_type:complete